MMTPPEQYLALLFFQIIQLPQELLSQKIQSEEQL
jgi:hypothetical protein